MEQDKVDDSLTYNICKEKKHKSNLKYGKYFKMTSSTECHHKNTVFLPYPIQDAILKYILK